MFRSVTLPSLAAVVALTVFAAPLHAQLVFDFEGTDPLDHPTVGGDTTYWQVTSDRAAAGTFSLRAYDPLVKPGSGDNYPQDPFESFTYDVPIALESGTITVDFYDTFGLIGMGTFEWGMSIILEDADNPADFVAVEVTRLPYGGGRYYGSEGIDEALPSVFDTYAAGPVRSVGWHTVTFTITPTASTVKVDAGPDMTEVQGPGGGANLRLRFMADSATAGGMGNWTVPGSDSYPGAPNAVFIDNIVFTATAPAAASATFGFESGEVDSAGEFMGPAAFDNPNQAGFVNDFGTTNTLVSQGSQSGAFVNKPEPFKSITFDLTDASPGSITMQVFDALGPDEARDAFGSIIIENGSNPADFITLELWNGPYPTPEPVKNYYAIRSNPGGGPSTFNSDYYADRSVGWHSVEIVLTETESYILIDGQENLDNGGRMTGPGLNTNPKLRLMNGSATNGGFSNWATLTDELDVAYLGTRKEHLSFDQISIPRAPAAVTIWALYQ